MKRPFTILTAAFSLAIAQNADAALLAYWNFNNLDDPSATSGTGTLDVTTGAGTVTWSGNPINLVYFGGTVTNMQIGDNRGVALALQNGVDGENNDSFLEFTLDLSEREDLVLSFAGQRTATGFSTIDVSWAVGAESFNPFGTLPTLESGMGTTSAVPAAIRTVDFSSLNNSIANESDVRIRLTFSGGSETAPGGNNRLDNVTFTAVPEPTTALLGGLGLLALLRRRR